MSDDLKAIDPDGFYDRHRGGSGNVIVVHAYSDDDQITGVFSSIETAQAWRDSLDEDEWTCVFAPYVVDEPDFGNVTRTN
jgi:hypothetical protein